MELFAKVSTSKNSMFQSWNYLPFPRVSGLYRKLEDGIRQSSLYISSIVAEAVNDFENKNNSNITDGASLLEKVRMLKWVVTQI